MGHGAALSSGRTTFPQPCLTIPVSFTDASLRERIRATFELLVFLVLLAWLVVPLLRTLAFLGPTTKTGILAWVLVVAAMYWMYEGLGFRPLLLLQLLLFSAAAALLTTKVALVLVGIHRLSILRRVASGLIMVGAAVAALNFLMMLWGVFRQPMAKPQEPRAEG